MGCDLPMAGYRSTQLHASGKSVLTFNPIKGRSNVPLSLPCGRCTGCRLERSRQWAVRMTHEAKMWANNCFITLTYDNEHCPTNYSLEPEHLQLFMKRLRHLSPDPMRFYACGEYGDRFGRPHYHAIIFNYAFKDKVMAGSNGLGQPYWKAEELTETWGMGDCMIGRFSFQSAAYVARYVTKKITGPQAHAHYLRTSPIDGKPYQVHPEFARMSLRPGIGADFAKEFKGDYFPSGFIVSNGVRQRPPRYYISKLSEEEQRQLKWDSQAHANQHRADNTKARRAVRTEARDLRITRLQRNLG